MLQILQNIKNGNTSLENIPTPALEKGCVLIKTTHSLVSLGTEKMLVEFSKSNIVQKAKMEPERVSQALNKIKTEGLVPTLETIFNKLDQPMPLGYCNVGEVIGLGKNVTEFSIGDRVVSNGPHAEIVSVPKNLVASIPESVTSEEAAFTVIGSVGLQGLRLLKPDMGETIVVYGLGLVGLITAQLLQLSGCKVVGIDLDKEKCKKASMIGIKAINPNSEDPIRFINSYTNENGCDGVLITASAKSDKIISNSAKMSRKRGRIILIGVVDLNLHRSDFYEKELTFQVSCSYGPGRYDYNYEQKGEDYPLPYVRWTEKRNFETILNSIADLNLNVKDLISEKVELKNFQEIYNNISNNNSIASILIYPQDVEVENKKIELALNKKKIRKEKPAIGIIGSGNFTKTTLLPFLNKINANIKYLASSSGINSSFLSKKYKIPISTTDYKNILSDENIDTVIITTRHDSHAQIINDALIANKKIFVEKPLAIHENEIEMIKKTINETGNTHLTVGYNRRFSSHIYKINEHIGSSRSSLNIVATMNAGFIDKDHWVNDLNIGGGRIIGEACHLIDLCVYLTNSRIKKVCMNSNSIETKKNTDNASIILSFENGSNAVINYFSNGSNKYPKERLEIHNQNKTFIIDNFQKTSGYGVKGFSTYKSRIDKGHYNQFKSLIENNENPLIPLNQIFNVTYASFAALESYTSKKWVDVKK